MCAKLFYTIDGDDGWNICVKQFYIIFLFLRNSILSLCIQIKIKIYSTYNSFCLQDLRSDPLKTHNKIYQLPMF